jgi:X-X-X-Leu-X-X-Gly heptad repeat protein
MKKKIITFLMLGILALGLPASVQAQAQPQPEAISLREESVQTDTPASGEKIEVIYANLDAAGLVQEINVVNMFQLQQAGRITDYGDYAAVQNLTNTKALTQSEDCVSIDAAPGDFYYQGTMNQLDLPWIFAVEYGLDDVAITPLDLAGREGRLELSICSKKNEAVDARFYDNFMLQITVTLDTEKCRNIVADKATEAQAGKDKMLTYTVMPGSDADIVLTADVTDFSMVGIDVAAVPFSLPFDVEGLSDMTEGLVLLSDAVRQLDDGVLQLKEGSAAFRQGMDTLNGGGAQLVEGSAAIETGLETIAGALSGEFGDFEFDWSTLDRLPDIMDDLAATLLGLSDSVSNMKGSMDRIDDAMAAIPDGALSAQEMEALYQNNPDLKGLIDQLYGGYTAGQQAKTIYGGETTTINQSLADLDSMVGEFETIAGQLTLMASLLRNALESGELDEMLAELSTGIDSLSQGYGLFHEGLVQYTGGVSQLTEGYHALDDGIRQLHDGTSRLNNATGNLPEEIELQMGDFGAVLAGDEYEPASFVSSKNENVSAVQFVLKLAGITAPEQQQEVADSEEISTSFLERFAALFNRKDPINED